jgi:protein-S-isoprenylcysteine O-methyltransferase Ste14
MLGSFWALIPAVITVILFVVRTGREDATLKRELVGYQAYAEKVRYRLFPGIW